MEVFILLITSYAQPRDAVRLSMTCKRLYRVLSAQLRLFMTCGNTRMQSLSYINPPKHAGGGYCVQCKTHHSDRKCPIGSNVKCIQCKAQGPKVLIRNLYSFEVPCVICKKKVCNNDHVFGCIKCGHVCKTCAERKCFVCHMIVPPGDDHKCTIMCGKCNSPFGFESLQCRDCGRRYCSMRCITEHHEMNQLPSWMSKRRCKYL